jgi:hypothetical protein
MDRYLSEPVRVEKPMDINELDKLLRALLECSPHCDSGYGKRVQVPRGPAAVYGDETRECHCPVGVNRTS